MPCLAETGSSQGERGEDKRAELKAVSWGKLSKAPHSNSSRTPSPFLKDRRALPQQDPVSCFHAQSEPRDILASAISKVLSALNIQHAPYSGHHILSPVIIHDFQNQHTQSLWQTQRPGGWDFCFREERRAGEKLLNAAVAWLADLRTFSLKPAGLLSQSCSSPE